MSLSANFKCIPRVCYIGEEVNFIDLSEGDPNYWEWDFGDNTSKAYEQNVIHSYSKRGSYTVTLKIKKDSLTDICIKNNYIIVKMEETGTGFVRDKGVSLKFD
jgi:PKD repeat protein